jgi:hypothetical protein
MAGEKEQQTEEQANEASELNGVLFTLMEEMERQSSGILEIAKAKAVEDLDGSRNLMTIGGVVGMLAECLKIALEKSK